MGCFIIIGKDKGHYDSLGESVSLVDCEIGIVFAVIRDFDVDMSFIGCIVVVVLIYNAYCIV